MGGMIFLTEMFAQEAAMEGMSDAQKAWIRSTSSWIYFVFGISVVTGIAGSVALLLRTNKSLMLFAVSFVAVLIQMTYTMIIAIRIAARHPELVLQLTLIASFVVSPAPAVARWLPWSWLFRLPPPLFVAKYFMVGDDHGMAVRLQKAIRQTAAATLAKRVRRVLEVDVCRELASLRCPLRYIRPQNDRLVSARAVRRIREVNPRVTVHEIAGPHLILQTRPEQSWSAFQPTS
jgi:pimeloyl-ACP methyl ester carboxylesterase